VDAGPRDMLAILGRFVVEVLFQGLLGLLEVLGHATGRAVVRLLTGGRVKVAPFGRREIVRRWHGLHRTTDGTPVIGEGLATALGLLLIALLIAACIVAIKSF